MGLNEVVDALERVERLLEDGQTGPAQDSLSWQRASDDADIQLGKACAMLGTCRQLRQGTNNYVSIVELSFNAIERSFQFYLVEMTSAESADYRKHEEVFADIAARNVFSDEEVASRIDAFRSEHRSRFYYDIDRPGRDFAMGMHDLAEEVHHYLVEFADAHSRCSCNECE
ncbi:hypothetical protein [Natronolimnobius baerhuensis]|uniref:DUF8154 domain-containing protein n=1 Tax=Natronolimnobius baerhuensis TaxID=253108 RepID=A0A202E3R3_9EURY|nr:hypothetical protein [Natronolimnobius baerhuensis]OVE82933.1 hypothetical protein B2G88_18250 [Natronolimnobius baerhuensis]